MSPVSRAPYQTQRWLMPGKTVTSRAPAVTNEGRSVRALVSRLSPFGPSWHYFHCGALSSEHLITAAAKYRTTVISNKSDEWSMRVPVVQIPQIVRYGANTCNRTPQTNPFVLFASISSCHRQGPAWGLMHHVLNERAPTICTGVLLFQ